MTKIEADTESMVLRTVFIPREMNSCLKIIAFQEARSVNAVIRSLAEEALKHRGYELVDGRLRRQEKPASTSSE
ncbi:hypothetical protein G6L37_04220 [Agrobacterium rubi]|nr:hypothetical protein [Agrobacterium rubi]NTF24557.1 hypothetical protein [Agrobacterium rubi]